MASPKQKPLLPVLKERKRYLSYEAYADRALPQSTGRIIVDELNSLLGVFDAASAGLLNIGFDASTNKGIIRVSNTSAHKARLALLLVHQLKGQPVMLRPVTASGVLRKAKQAIVRD